MKPNFPIMHPRRTLSALIAFLGFYAAAALPLLFIFGPRDWIFGVALVVGVAAAAYVWARVDTGPGALARPVFGGAILFGVVGFAIGFFGPMVIAPQANQGPLLGTFITGPAGILVGAIAGLIFGIEKSRR